ncbi:hypothetical protein GCM10027030_00260 [Luteococcus sediminum]
MRVPDGSRPGHAWELAYGGMGQNLSHEGPWSAESTVTLPRPEEAPVLLVLATAPAMIGLAYWLGAP